MNLSEALTQAVQAGKLRKESAQNIQKFLSQKGIEPWMHQSVEELVQGEFWTELNDRFFKTLAFGTGGLRGRTIGKVVTLAEQGEGGYNDRPQHPAVGTNAMNDVNVGRAAQGLVNYLRKQFPHEAPKVVITCDSRHFSMDFAELTARIVAHAGGTAFLYTNERSTPQLSFSVRYFNAHAGVLITASHNPSHDNGFKAYFQDGAQLVEPHASGVISEVEALSAVVLEGEPSGTIQRITTEVDEPYRQTLRNLVLREEELLDYAPQLKVVFTPLHGVGGMITPDILREYGFQVLCEPQQSILDGRFPTVTSPNPENASAFELALELARKEDADLVFATDPDADRMGVAVRRTKGDYVLLTGNQMGSLIAEYRVQTMKTLKWITPANVHNAVLIKTFVTTDLQRAIAESHGLACVDTLTGFKYIGEKLKDYELKAGGRGSMDATQWRNARLEKSRFFVFGGEESYGYAGSDEVRDKDANAAVLMLSEIAALAKAEDQTLLHRLEALYRQHGFYWESLGNLYFEGAEGAAKIQKLLQSYRQQPPTRVGDYAVEKIQNFAEQEIMDIDGKILPKELMLMFTLQDGFRIAVRASGTEPKMKFYFFGRAPYSPEPTAFDQLKAKLNTLWQSVQEDVEKRIAE